MSSQPLKSLADCSRFVAESFDRPDVELTSVFHECTKGRRKLAVKVVDIFGNDTMTIVEVRI